jgi:prevent-host-death family protein
MDELDDWRMIQMETITANDAKQNFGRIMDLALQAPVSVTKHGRPSVVITSEATFQELLAFKREHLKAEVNKGFEGLDRGDVSPRTAEEIAESVLERHRGR